MANYLTSYFEQAKERQAAGVEPLALNAEFTKELVSLLKTPPVGSENDLLHLLKDRINPGVDESSKIKADFLYEIATGKAVSPIKEMRLIAFISYHTKFAMGKQKAHPRRKNH